MVMRRPRFVEWIEHAHYVRACKGFVLSTAKVNKILSNYCLLLFVGSVVLLLNGTCPHLNVYIAINTALMYIALCVCY